MPEREVSRSSVGRLRAELTAAGLLGRRERRVAWSAGIVLAGLGAGIAWLVLGPRDAWQLVNAAGCGFLMVQVGFLAHDAGHGALSRSARMNRFLSWLCWTLFTGLSDAWWRDKHQRHHRHVNDPALDPDFYPILSYTSVEAIAASGMKRVIARRQALLLAPLLACSRLYFQVLSIAFAFRHPGARLRDLPLMAVHHAIFVGLPLVLLELPLAAAFLVVSYAVTGLYMGLVFMPNHWGMPLLSASRSGVAPSEQVRVTRNVATGAVGDWLWGGLNYQIEHHLFPDMPRAAMPAAARCVAAFCAREGIAYHQLSPLAAWAEVLQHAHVVGAALRRPQGTGALGRPC